MIFYESMTLAKPNFFKKTMPSLAYLASVSGQLHFQITCSIAVSASFDRAAISLAVTF